MAEVVWLALNKRERQIVIEALKALKESKRVHAARLVGSKEIDSLVSTFLDRRHPDITIGVYGGQVQWVTGNPFPIRIVDYDGDAEDLPDFDDDGNKCRSWLEPAERPRSD